MSLGGPELLIVVALAVLIFGAGWLPKAARNLGKAKVEFDDAAKQFADAKNSVVEASGVKQLDATMRKANKALNTSPQKMLKDAAKSAVAGAAATPTADTPSPGDDDIEDAEIVKQPSIEKSSVTQSGSEPSSVETRADAPTTGPTDTDGDGTINVDFA